MKTGAYHANIILGPTMKKYKNIWGDIWGGGVKFQSTTHGHHGTLQTHGAAELQIATWDQPLHHRDKTKDTRRCR